MTQILHRYTSVVLAEGEGTLRDVVVESVAKRADLRGAYLWDADLRGADLTGAILSWQSHDLIAEILRRAAGDAPGRLMVAGLPLVTRIRCWDWYAATLTPEQCEWCAGVLAPWAREDAEAPAALRTTAASQRGESEVAR